MHKTTWNYKQLCKDHRDFHRTKSNGLHFIPSLNGNWHLVRLSPKCSLSEPQRCHVLLLSHSLWSSVPTLFCWLLLLFLTSIKAVQAQSFLSSLPTLPRWQFSPNSQSLNIIPMLMTPRFVSPVLNFPLSSRFLYLALFEYLIGISNLTCPKLNSWVSLHTS